MSSAKPNPGESLAEKRPDVAAEWNYEKNGDLTPWGVKCGSRQKVWWKCSNRHEWQALISNRIYKNSCCPYCINHSSVGVIQGVNDLATTNPELINEWDFEKNILNSPEELRTTSVRKVYWKCKNGHSWESNIYIQELY